MTTAARTEANGKVRKSLAEQIDRLDGILDGLDAALSGAVQDAVEQAVKQAVQSVLTEILTNRELQDQLRPAAQPADSREEKSSKAQGPMRRLWSAAQVTLHQAVQTVKKASRGIGAALLAAGGMVVGGIYAARKPIASAASFLYHQGKALLGKVGSCLGHLLPTFGFCGT